MGGISWFSVETGLHRASKSIAAVQHGTEYKAEAGRLERKLLRRSMF
jgi:hypothetical protein